MKKKKVGIKHRRSNCSKSMLACQKERKQARVMWMVKSISGVAALLFISFVFIFGHDFITQCTYFEAAKVEVAGNKRLSTATVRRQAQIEVGTNILAINMKMARKRLLAYTWIAEAEVRREFPNKIYIHIQEHEPLAVLDLGRKLTINRQGVIFKTHSSDPMRRLPVVTGLTYADINVTGQPRSRAYSAVMEILNLSHKAKAVFPAQRLTRIHLDREIGATLYTAKGRQAIKLGYGQYEEKYDRLKNVIYYLDSKKNFNGFESIDLNDLNRVIVDPVRVVPTAKRRKEV
jgi:cell division protein FtsQ